MKNYKLLWGASALILAGAVAVPMVMDQTKQYAPRTMNAFSEKEEQGILGAQQWLFNMRKNQVTGTIDDNDVLAARQQALYFDQLAAVSHSTAAAPNLIWQEVGPDNVGGRTRAIVIDKNNTNRMYAGGVSGGLWISDDAGSNWHKYSDQLQNLAVTSICQAANGDIYFGTGEGNGLYYLLGSGSAGILGGGVWKSSDNGQTFTHLASTNPNTANSASADWAAVSKMAADPIDPNRIYAATDKGLRMTIDGGATWTNPVTVSMSVTTPVTSIATDVEVAADGAYVLASIGAKLYKSATGATQTWDNISDGGTNELPASGLGRIEFNISPDDHNYIYASAATSAGALNGIYLSTDGGDSWTIIGHGGSLAFDPFGPNKQGTYNNCIGVIPGNKYSVLVGGLELWRWDASATDPFAGQWTRITLENPNVPQNPYYVHADKHVITFKPGNGNVFYIGCDGGIFKSIDGGQTYIQSNKSYNVTQFYSVAFKPFNMDPYGVVGNIVMGGAQDNGTQFIDGQGNTPQSATQVNGGDGAWAEFSMLNPNAMFATVYYGSLSRSANDGSSMADFYSSRINALNPGNDPAAASFVTPIALWESRHDLTSPDSVVYVTTQAYAAGATFTVPSKIIGHPITYTTPVALANSDTIKVQDYYQSKLAVGFNGAIFMTRGALDFSTTPLWTKIAGPNSKPNAFTKSTSSTGQNVQCMKWASNGDILYFGTENGKVFRLSNLLSVIDSTKNGDIDSLSTQNKDNQINCTQIGSFSGRCITSIAVDPNNANRIVVTLGNYGNTQYVYYCSTATAAPSNTSSSSNFVSVSTTATGLPAMPVYSSTFDKWNPNRVVLGTEQGIYATDNITASTVQWDHTTSSTNFPVVPVFQVRQAQWPTWESNISGYFYAATHGRGIWRTNNTAAPVGINDPEPSGSSNTSGISVVVSPNPVSESALVAFTLKQSSDVTLKIYDLRGKLVKTVTRPSEQAGVVQIQISSDGLNAGTYLVSIEAGAQRGTTRFVVVK
jgi:hypothetical protein